MLSVSEYLNHWKENWGSKVIVPNDELTDEMRADAVKTVSRANALLTAFGEDRDMTSGWRPVEVNKLVSGAALYSNHTRCRAIDIADPHGDLDEWCLDHLDILEQLDLWQEHPSSTKGWCHVQIVPPKSGKRVFYP